MRRQELEKVLRECEPMRGAQVNWPDAFKHAMHPHLVLVRGIVSIRGEEHMYELEVDLRSFQTRQDVELLIKTLLHSFEKAEKGIGVTHTAID